MFRNFGLLANELPNLNSILITVTIIGMLYVNRILIFHYEMHDVYILCVNCPLL